MHHQSNKNKNLLISIIFLILSIYFSCFVVVVAMERNRCIVVKKISLARKLKNNNLCDTSQKNDR